MASSRGGSVYLPCRRYWLKCARKIKCLSSGLCQVSSGNKGCVTSDPESKLKNQGRVGSHLFLVTVEFHRLQKEWFLSSTGGFSEWETW
jgi:hypothetical protein